VKVAHVVPSFYPARAYGGPTESVYRLCRAVAGPDCDVRVLTTNANGRGRTLDVPADVETRLQERLTVRYCVCRRGDSISPGLLRNLTAYIRWSDIVHLEAVYSLPTIPTLWIAGRLGKPVVWSPRGALARWSGARHPWLKNVYDRICRMSRNGPLVLHCTSDQELEGSLRRFPGVDGAVIPNGVESVKNFSRVPPEGKLRLLYLGRLDPIKGIENLLSACARLNKTTVGPWELSVAGGGDAAYMAQLWRQVRQSGLDADVRLIGPVEGSEKESAFASADVVVVPSHLENFCIVAAEALVRGIPVIASRGTPWSGLEDKGCGLWVANDPESLARAIERMRNLPRQAMGEKGRAWMEAEFSWDRVGERMIRLYRRLLEGKR
jgi:glycosyltransferase involved in cell wall biosynthesis